MYESNALLSRNSAYPMGFYPPSGGSRVFDSTYPSVTVTCSHDRPGTVSYSEPNRVLSPTEISHHQTIQTRMRSLNSCMDASFKTRQHVLQIRRDFPQFLEQHPHLYSNYLEERTKLINNTIQHRKQSPGHPYGHYNTMGPVPSSYQQNNNPMAQRCAQKNPSHPYHNPWVQTGRFTMSPPSAQQFSVYHKPKTDSNRQLDRSSYPHDGGNNETFYGHHNKDRDSYGLVSRSDEENIHPSTGINVKSTSKWSSADNCLGDHKHHQQNHHKYTNLQNASSVQDVNKFKKKDGGESIKSNQSFISEGNFSLPELSVAGFMANKMDGGENSTKRSEGGTSAFNYLLDICTSEVSNSSSRHYPTQGEWKNAFASEFPLPDSLNGNRYSVPPQDASPAQKSSTNSLKFSEAFTPRASSSSNEFRYHKTHGLVEEKQYRKRLSWRQDPMESRDHHLKRTASQQYHSSGSQSQNHSKSKFRRKTIRRRGPSVNSPTNEEMVVSAPLFIGSTTKSDSIKTFEVIKAVETIFENPMRSSFAPSEDRWQPVRIMDRR